MRNSFCLAPLAEEVRKRSEYVFMEFHCDGPMGSASRDQAERMNREYQIYQWTFCDEDNNVHLISVSCHVSSLIARRALSPSLVTSLQKCPFFSCKCIRTGRGPQLADFPTQSLR